MILRRYLAIPAIIVLAVAADITVRLMDDPGRGPASSPPPIADGGPSPSLPDVTAPAAPASPTWPAPPGWSRTDSPVLGTSSPGPHRTGGGPARVSHPPGKGGGGPGGASSNGGGPQVASLDEMLRRDDPLPPGVTEQLSFIGGGESDCDNTEGLLKPPLDVAVVSANTIPGLPVICILASYDAARVTMTTPAGTVLSTIRPQTADGFDEIPFPLAADSPAGVYRVSVRQGKEPETATTEFRVRPLGDPLMSVFPRESPAGGTVQVELGDFPPGPAELYLYACDENFPDLPTFRSILTVNVNASGTAQLTVNTTTFTPPACYLLVSARYFDRLPPALSDWTAAHATFVLR